MWFSVALRKFHWSGINWHVFNQSECRNCCLYIIIQKIAPHAKSGKYFQIWFFPRFGGKNGGVLSMRMQVILDSSFARPGSAPIWGRKKGEFRDWTMQPPVSAGKRLRTSHDLDDKVAWPFSRRKNNCLALHSYTLRFYFWKLCSF